MHYFPNSFVIGNKFISLEKYEILGPFGNDVIQTIGFLKPVAINIDTAVGLCYFWLNHPDLCQI